jgi:hypothetical protein
MIVTMQRIVDILAALADALFGTRLVPVRAPVPVRA